MNSVNIIGRLTRDPELRKTSNGRSVTNPGGKLRDFEEGKFFRKWRKK